MVAALPLLKDLKDKIHFVHQIGRWGSQDEIQRAYLENGFSAEVYPFIHEMGKFYGRADVVIARSGANTVAELVALKKPSLLIPYPFAARGHQETNALALQKAGAAKVLLDSETTGQSLAKEIRTFVTLPGLLEQMQKSLEKLEGNQAAEKIVDECLGLVKNV